MRNAPENISRGLYFLFSRQLLKNTLIQFALWKCSRNQIWSRRKNPFFSPFLCLSHQFPAILLKRMFSFRYTLAYCSTYSPRDISFQSKNSGGKLHGAPLQKCLQTSCILSLFSYCHLPLYHENFVRLCSGQGCFLKAPPLRQFIVSGNGSTTCQVTDP